MRFLTTIAPLFFLFAGCSESSDPKDQTTQSGGAPSVEPPSGGASSGGQVAVNSGGAATVAPPMIGGSSGGEVSAGGSESGGSMNLGSGGDTLVGAGGDPIDGAGGETGVGGSPSLEDFAAGLHELFIHDECTGVQSQEDTCTHVQLIEETITFGGDAETTYRVTLRVRGLFEPTNIAAGDSPLPDHPYFVVGGTVQAGDYSQWQIDVQEPAEVYTLNHYPQTSHTIYQEDFEAQIVVQGGSDIVVRVRDANDRQIDNSTSGLADRQQTIEGVTEGVLDGQVLRLDVVSVEVQE